MTCTDKTPWTITNHPYTINRVRSTGGYTDQITGEWVSDASGNSAVVCGYIGRGTAAGHTGMRDEDIQSLAGGSFTAGDQYYVCHTDCDIALNDLLEVYGDAAGTIKTYWRIITHLKALTTYKNLRGVGQDYWLIRREER